jgi:hypothetical protein
MSQKMFIISLIGNKGNGSNKFIFFALPQIYRSIEICKEILRRRASQQTIFTSRELGVLLLRARLNSFPLQYSMAGAIKPIYNIISARAPRLADKKCNVV